MADRFPLILNTSANQIQEIASGDTLDLTNTNISNAGIITASSFVGNVTGDVAGRITGDVVGNINSAGVSTFITLDVNGDVDFDGHTHIDNMSVSGVSTFASNLDANGDLDVDGHTNLDNVSVAGVTTFSGATTMSGDLRIQNALPNIYLTDTDNDSDYLLTNSNGHFIIRDVTNNAMRVRVLSSGNVNIFKDLDVDGHTNLDNVSVAGVTTFTGNLDANGDLDVDGHTNLDNVSVAGVSTFAGNADFSAGIDVTGNLIASGNLTANNGTVTVSGTAPKITFTETNDNPDYKLESNGGNIAFVDTTNSATRLSISSSGINVTGNGTFSGNVSIGGTLTYEDVTNIDSVGIITARTSIKLDADGSASSNFLSIGADDDLKIFHQSNVDKIESSAAGFHIRQINNGDLHIHAGANTGSANNRLVARAGGKAELYYGGNLKLSTETGGVNITGVCTATTFSGSGASLTNLNGSNIASGTVPVARIGTGTKSTSTFYRGDGTFATVTAPAITAINSASNNRLVTSDGGTTVTAESSLTYDTYLSIVNSRSDTNFTDNSAPGGVNGIFISNSQSTNGVFSAITLSANDVNGTNQSGSFIAKSVSGGYVPEVHITQRTGGNTNESNFKITSSRAVELRYQGNNRLETSNEGVKIGRTMFTGSTTNVANEAVVIAPSTDAGDAYNDNHVVSIGQLNGNWSDGTGGADTAFGMMFSYANGSNAAKQLRGGIVYDHKSTEQLQIWSSYGAIAFYTDTANSGNETPVTCNVKCAEFDGSGHFVPGSNAARDLGTSGLRWRNIYTNDLNLSNEGGKNEVDGTWGNYTIQEGESDLFLINKRSGKKYKFNLTEVS